MSSYSDCEPLAPTDPVTEIDDRKRVSLCEALDRILNTGVVLAGEIVISVADIDLVYLNLQLLLSSIETASRGARLAAATTTPKSPCEH